MGSRCGVPAKLGVIAFPRQEESVTNQMRREIYAQHKCDEHLQAEKPNQSESTKTPYEPCGQRRQLDDHGSHRRKLAQPRRLRQKAAEPSRRGVREKLSQPDGAHVRGGHPGQSAIPELGACSWRSSRPVRYSGAWPSQPRRTPEGKASAPGERATYIAARLQPALLDPCATPGRPTAHRHSATAPRYRGVILEIRRDGGSFRSS